MVDREAAWTTAIGSAVRDLRVRQRISQLKLANMAGMPGQNSYISRLETGKWSAERTAELLDLVAPCLETTRVFIESQARLSLAGDDLAPPPAPPAAPVEPAPTPAPTPSSTGDLAQQDDPGAASSMVEASHAPDGVLDQGAGWTAAVGSVVRELRTRQALSQMALAVKAGMPGGNWHICRLETGKSSAHRTAELVDIVAPLLGTTREFVESQARRVLAGEVVAPTPDAPAASAPATTPASAAPAVTPPAAVPSAPDLERQNTPIAAPSTLDACVAFAEAHLLRQLEDGADELDAFAVHALATALAHLEEVRDRRLERGH